MKNVILLMSCLLCISFTKPGINLEYLYQSWQLKQYKRNNGNPQLTYIPTESWGHMLGYQFRKDGTVSVSQSINNYLSEISKPRIEVVNGNWKINESAHLEIAYTSNGYTYLETFTIQELGPIQLVLQQIE